MASSVVSGRQLEKWEKEREDANRTEIPMPKAARDSFNSMQPNFNALAKFEKKLDRFTQRMEDKDSGVKTEAIVNVMSSTAGAGSGDFHTYRGFRKKENARIADFEAARKEDEARRAWEAVYITRLLLGTLLLGSANAFLLNGVRPQPTSARTDSAVMMPKVAKTIAVLLEKEVEGLGVEGDLVQVKPSYADNFIVPKGLGVKASKDDLTRIAAAKEAAEAAAVAAKAKAEGAKAELQKKYGKGMVIEVQVGKDGLPAEEVNAETIASMLKAAAGVDVAVEDVDAPEMAQLDSYVVELKLGEGVRTSLKVKVEKSKITFS